MSYDIIKASLESANLTIILGFGVLGCMLIVDKGSLTHDIIEKVKLKDGQCIFVIENKTHITKSAKDYLFF